MNHRLPHPVPPRLLHYCSFHEHKLETLLLMPLRLPSREPRRLFQRPYFPIPLNHPLVLLLRIPLLQGRQGDVLDMPGILVLHHILLPLLEHLRNQRWDVWFSLELLDRREQGFEVEDDSARDGEATEGLPVDAKVDTIESQLGILEVAVFLMWVAWRHEEGSVDFETPRAALDGTVSGHAREVSDWGMC